ncbi:MAG: class I SAM-dependent methyltransferase [Acetatifactor sp.]|nr:class I SAM-dependent methyltransferase [Acetatifactor sp.]
MAMQNIFDEQEFFEGYKNLRDQEKNANILFEIPALFSLLPDLKGKSVLDLGCGFGEHCIEYVKKGACKVTGIDISEKMLEAARKENSDPKVEYLNMPIEEIDRLSDRFDLVISSLAFHYVEDFEGVVNKIYELMSEGGTFIFSQENPLNTCFSGKFNRWTRDENGNKIYMNLTEYGVEGEKESKWFVDGIKKYHRMFSTIINTLTKAGFIVEKLIEPLPDDELLKRYPEYCDLFHKPDFLIVKVLKK